VPDRALSSTTALRRTRAGRVAAGLLIVLGLVAAAGLVALRPGGDRAQVASGIPGTTRAAEVTRVGTEGCAAFAGPRCTLVEVRLDDGSASFLALPIAAFAPDLRPGDEIEVAGPPGRPPPALDDPGAQPLAFVDFRRGTPLLALAVAFAVLVLALARWQGLRSLLGLGICLAVVILWMLPALLDGRSPLLVALVGGLVVMLATTALTHGIGLKSTAAMIGASATLALIVALTVLAVDAAHITGLSSEEATLVEARSAGDLSIQGLVLAGMVIGALGVLDDVTVSQASTVLALRRANPSLSGRALFTGSMAVGRDHLGATVNTLVLAYAGASLPVLLVFAAQGTSLGAAVTREAVAQQVVATLVGSIGLIAALPLTTALTALLATRIPPAAAR
jgi:hypothetical protein